MFFRIAGSIERGCMTFAPKYESSMTSMYEILFKTRASLITLGSDVMMPSTSVQIQISSASIPAPTMDAE